MRDNIIDPCFALLSTNITLFYGADRLRQASQASLTATFVPLRSVWHWVTVGDLDTFFQSLKIDRSH